MYSLCAGVRHIITWSECTDVIAAVEDVISMSIKHVILVKCKMINFMFDANMCTLYLNGGKLDCAYLEAYHDWKVASKIKLKSI